MELDKNIGNRLESARKCCGISVRKVADYLKERGHKVSHTTIVNYEKGKCKPALTLLTELADYYDRPINWFLQSGYVLCDVSYRALKKVTVKEKRRFESISQRWLDAYCKIEDVLAEGLEHEVAGFDVFPRQCGRDVALRLRQELDFGIDPIPSVIEVLHCFGIRVIAISDEARIDGLAGLFGGEPVVVLNDTLSNDRIRLNAAHELGHHLYGHHKQAGGQTESEIEGLAFEFASHFLMPSVKLKEAFEGYSMVRLVEYKNRYGMSLAAMIYRAHEEGFVTESMYKLLWREFSKRGWRKKEPGHVHSDRPTRFEMLIERAVSEKNYTWTTLSRITGLRETELRDRMNSVLRSYVIKEGGQAMN